MSTQIGLSTPVFVIHVDITIKEKKMPYIAQKDRTKFVDQVLETIDAIMGGAETTYIKGEHFGYWANRVVMGFVRDPRSKNHSFNSANFNATRQARLAASADKISALIPNTDPIVSAGDLNYVLSSVYWGILGEAKGIPKANYGFRTYLKGILRKILLKSIESNSSGSQRDATMSFRRCLVADGVVSDVIDECYRLHTVEYENEKITQNAFLWVAGRLIAPTEEV